MKDDLKSPIIIKYQNLYKEDPTSRVFAPLAEAYRKFGMVDEAIEILRKGIKHHPDFILGYLGLAYCYYDQEEYNLAYEVLRPHINNNRENIRLQKIFADTCFELKKEREALDAYKYLLYINPRDNDAAQRVKELESEHAEEDLILSEISPEENEASAKFSIDELDNGYEDSADEWVRVDMEKHSAPSEESEDSANSWEMQKLEDTTSSISSLESSEAPVQLEQSDESSTEEDIVNSPVSHTLVDLYLEQGARDKAIEVLEKIIELNPTDQHSLTRLDDLRNDAVSVSQEHNEVPSNGDEALEQRIEMLTRFKEAILARSSEKRTF